jgi:outer membrane receptor for ferrienterochelin and colicin
MDHLIVFNSGNYTNLDAQTRGVEAALEASWADGTRIRASYSFQHTMNDTVTWQLPDSPNHLVKIDVTVPIYEDKLFAGAEFRYTSDRLSLHNTTDAMGEPVTMQGENAGAYGIINLTLYSQKIIKNLEVSASVYNLLDRRYQDPASLFHVQDTIQQDGRSFRMKLTYHF